MTEQEAIRVLREALEDIAWKRTPNERKSAEWVDRHEQRALAAIATTATIPPVAAPAYWMSIQHGEFKVSYTDDSDPVYTWFPVWVKPVAAPEPVYQVAIDSTYTWADVPKEVYDAHLNVQWRKKRVLYTAAPAQAAPDEVMVAWFRQASSFGPWVECKPTDEGAMRFTAKAATPVDSQKGESSGA